MQDCPLGNNEALTFDNTGVARSTHHLTSYDYPSCSLIAQLPQGAKVVLQAPFESTQRIEPALRTLPSAMPYDVSFYTYSAVIIDGNIEHDFLCKRGPCSTMSEELDHAMARVSKIQGNTLLSVLCFSKADVPIDENSYVCIRRETRYNYRGFESTTDYIYPLRYWISQKDRLSKYQWYQEIEDLRLRKTERAYWHVEHNLNASVLDHGELIDPPYEWFDVDAFGDGNQRPIVWWNHPDREQAIKAALTPFSVEMLGTADADQRCPICLDPFQTDQDEGDGNNGELPVYMPCRCARPCGEACLLKWLAQEGPSRCPLCRDPVGVPIFTSPYVGGWCHYQPKAHHIDSHLWRDFDGDIFQLDGMGTFTVCKGMVRNVDALFYKHFDTMGPALSVNLEERFRFRLTDPSPAYRLDRDPLALQVIRTSIKEIFDIIAHKHPVIRAPMLYACALQHVHTRLKEAFDSQQQHGKSDLPVRSVYPLHFYENSLSNISEDYIVQAESRLEPTIAAFVRRICVQATTMSAFHAIESHGAKDVFLELDTDEDSDTDMDEDSAHVEGQQTGAGVDEDGEWETDEDTG